MLPSLIDSSSAYMALLANALDLTIVNRDFSRRSKWLPQVVSKVDHGCFRYRAPPSCSMFFLSVTITNTHPAMSQGVMERYHVSVRSYILAFSMHCSFETSFGRST